jgi:twinfilin-like protein
VHSLDKVFSLFVSVFIYTMPGYSCSIKERMLYSSCKNGLVERLEQILGLEISKKVDIASQ